MRKKLLLLFLAFAVCMESRAGFLWQIKDQGTVKGHILGTVHYGYELNEMPELVREALLSSSIVMTEIRDYKLDELPTSTTTSVRDLMSSAGYQQLENWYSSVGADPTSIDSKEPWEVLFEFHAQAFQKYLPHLVDKTPLDVEIFNLAQTHGIPHEPLDTPAIYKETLDTIRNDFDAEELERYVRNPRLAVKVLEDMFSAYRHRDIMGLNKVIESMFSSAVRPESRQAREEVHQRHDQWVPHILQNIRSVKPGDSIFIAAGAAHLTYGVTNLVELLNARGLEVTRVDLQRGTQCASSLVP